MADGFEPGTRWKEVESNRVIVIHGPGPMSPWWYYQDDPKKEFWHCYIEDFTIWKRFTKLP